MAAAGGTKTRSSSSATWSSGSCASPTTRRNCSTASTSYRLAGKSPHHAAQLDWAQRRRDSRVRGRRPASQATDNERCAPQWTSISARASRPEVKAVTARKKIAVFTTRIDTIFGATSLQLAPEHPLVAEFAARRNTRREVAALARQQKKAREAGDIGGIEKHGVFTGHYAINPSTASACRSGSPTTSCSTTAPAPSCRCPRTTSATTSSPRSTTWRSAS